MTRSGIARPSHGARTATTRTSRSRIGRTRGVSSSRLSVVGFTNHGVFLDARGLVLLHPITLGLPNPYLQFDDDFDNEDYEQEGYEKPGL